MQWWSTGHLHPGDLQWPGNWVVGQTHRFDSAHTPTCLFWRFSESERCPQWAWHLPVFEQLRTKNKLFIHLVTVCWNNVLSMVVDNIIKTSCLLFFKEIFVPLEHFSVMWRRHHYWWIAEFFFIYTWHSWPLNTLPSACDSNATTNGSCDEVYDLKLKYRQHKCSNLF